MAVAWLRVTEPPRQLQRAPIFASIAEGARFVLGHQILLGALALYMFAVLFGGAISLAPAFIKEILHYGPEGLGILRGAPALGAVAMRSEEHTSELQSLMRISYAVFCLTKKKRTSYTVKTQM